MAEPAVVQLMRRFKRQLLEGEQEQMAVMTREWRGIEQRLVDTIDALARQVAELRDAGQPVTQAMLFRLDRYQRLLAQTRAEYARFADVAGDLIAGAQREWGGLALSHAAAQMGAGGASIQFTRLPTEAVEQMVGMLADGTPLRAWLTTNASDAQMIDRMTSALLDGTARGVNPRAVARQMRDGLSGGLNRALNTARTAQMGVYREATRQAYAQSGVVAQYQRLATRDNRTCMACLLDDGAVYDVGEVMPEHNQGRCTMVPVIEGRPLQWETGREWFTRQPVATQREMMGPSRYALWRNGQIELDQLITRRRDAVWGDALHTAPLSALE